MTAPHPTATATTASASARPAAARPPAPADDPAQALLTEELSRQAAHLQHYPQDMDAQAQVAELLARLGRWPETARWCRKVWLTRPNTAPAARIAATFAEALFRLNALDELRRFAHDLSTSRPDVAEVLAWPVREALDYWAAGRPPARVDVHNLEGII